MALCAPALFLTLGYGLMYIAGKPVIQFVTSSLELFLLADVPTGHSAEAATTALTPETKAAASAEQTQLAESAMTDFKAVTDAAVEQKLIHGRLPSSDVHYPSGGQQYGQIQMATVGLNVPLYYGDTEEILRLGAGQYFGSVFPGETGTTLIAGHNLDGFNKMNGLKIGDAIQLKTNYANYTYQVTKANVRNKEDEEIDHLIKQKKKHLLILYTCHSETSFGLTDNRLFVICELKTGPEIDPNT